MANPGYPFRSRPTPSSARRRCLKFELLDQRRVLASMMGPLLGDVDPSLTNGSEAGGSDLPVVYLSVAQSPTSLETSELSPSSLLGASISLATLADESPIAGELVAGGDSWAYTANGRYLTAIDLATGVTETLELPAAIRSIELLSDGRLLAFLEIDAAPSAGGDESSESDRGATPAAIVVSFASGDWEAVVEAGADGSLGQQWFAAAVADGDRGLVAAAGSASSDAEASLTLRSLYRDADNHDWVARTLPYQVAFGTELAASSSGPLTLVSEPSEEGRRLSLWSTRADAPVVGSELNIAGISDTLAFDDATSLAVVRQIDGGVQILDAANRFASLASLSDWNGPVALDSGREWLFGVVDNLTLEIFDIREGRTLYALPLDTATAGVVGGIALADGGNRLALRTSSGISQLRLDRLETRRLQSNADALPVDRWFGSYADGAEIDPGEVMVPENEDGALIADLQATGINVDLETEFRVYDERFVIDGAQLRLASGASLDFELEPVVRVEVVLADVNSGETLARQMVEITVENVDDPVTNIGLDRHDLPERTPGYVVSPVRVVDQDSYEHDLSVDDGRFEIVHGSLKLRDGVFVRRADQAEILITITATESDSAASSFSQELILRVTANDTPLHNATGPTDVNGDGDTDPIDALILINFLNKRGPGAVGTGVSSGEGEPYFYDVNGDGLITPLDALIIINTINRRGGGHAESGGTQTGAGGEGEATPPLQVARDDQSSEPILASGPDTFEASKLARGTFWETESEPATPVEDETSETSAEAEDSRDDFFTGLASNLG